MTLSTEKKSSLSSYKSTLKHTLQQEHIFFQHNIDEDRLKFSF